MAVSALIALAIAAALAGAAAGGTTYALSKGSQANRNQRDKSLEDGTFSQTKGWFDKKDNYSATEKAKFLKQYLKDAGLDMEFINSMSDKELAAYADEYMNDDYDVLGFSSKTFDKGSFLHDIRELQDIDNAWQDVPNAPDYDKIYRDAANTINQENAELSALYDRMLNSQTANYQQQMNDLNSAYRDYSRQILSNDYIQNAQLMNTVGSSLSKSRQNALQAGASAGLRLANNVNTLLSTQNQQTAQSLQTSNNLAQMLLNQRQAAAGIRNDYNNALNQNTMNKANLKAGNAERVENYARGQLDTANTIYQNKLNSWENSLNAKAGSNVFADAYKTYKSQSANKYGY